MIANVNHNFEKDNLIKISILIEDDMNKYPPHSLEELITKIKSVIDSHGEPKSQILARMEKEVENIYGVTVFAPALSFKTQFDFQKRTYSFYDKDLNKLQQKKEAKKQELFEEAGLLISDPFPNEVFHPIPGNKKEVMVSNLGRVYIIDDGLKVEFIGFVDRGYIRINVGGKRKYLHQIVAQMFLGHRINGHTLVVDHINGDTLDNRAENLQILPNAQNVIKGMRMKKELCKA